MKSRENARRRTKTLISFAGCTPTKQRATTTKRRGRIAASSDDDAAPVPPPPSSSSSSASGLATKHSVTVEDLRDKLADAKHSIKELQREIAAAKGEKVKADQRATEHEKQIQKLRASTETEIERMRQLIRRQASDHAAELESQRSAHVVELVEADKLLQESETSGTKRVAMLEARLETQALERIESSKQATEREVSFADQI